MTDIPEEFQDVPRLPNGKPDFRTKRGKELKAFLSQPVFESEPYGFCPQCGQAGVNRERRPNGNDICAAGHMYPSKDALPSVEQAPMDGGGTEEAGDERFSERDMSIIPEDIVPCDTPYPGGPDDPELRAAWDRGIVKLQQPAQATVTAAVPSATPMPSLGTSQSGQWLLAQIAEAYPEVRYNQWNRVKATFVHAQRNLLAWRRLTQKR